MVPVPYTVCEPPSTTAATASIGKTNSAAPVVDPTIKTVYVGSGVYSETSLAKSGTLPDPATSVNGSTHTIYSPGYVITRSGS